MKYTNTVFKKIAFSEEYLPLSIRSEFSLENANYLIYRCGNDSLLEIAFNESDGNIYKINVVICKNYHTIDTTFENPNNFTAKRGDVLVEKENDVTTHKFECIIYKDAIRLELSDNPVAECIDSNNILWELDNEGELISFTLYGQSFEIIEHTRNELAYDNQ